VIASASWAAEADFCPCPTQTSRAHSNISFDVRTKTTLPFGRLVTATLLT